MRYLTAIRPYAASLACLAAIATVLLLSTGADTPTATDKDAQLARGKYLAMHVSMCIDCHSHNDESQYSGALVPGTEGAGGEKFPGDFGMLVAPNITPHGIGKWTDEELYAALTTGARKDNNYIFPLMPWPSYSRLSEYDLRAIIAYIRTLEPVESAPDASEYKVPVDVIAKGIPVAAERPATPDPKDRVAYGRYLVNAAACFDCHTQQSPKGPVMELAFAGGMRFDLPSNPVVSANITPDKATGIGNWTEQQFLERFTRYREKLPKVRKGQPNSIMPWSYYAGMTDDDIKAMYAYLRTLPAVENKVTAFPAQ